MTNSRELRKGFEGARLELVEKGREHNGIALIPAHRGVGVEAELVKGGTEVGAREEVRGFEGALGETVGAVVFNVRAIAATMEQVRWFEGVTESDVAIAPRARGARGVNVTPGEDLTRLRGVEELGLIRCQVNFLNRLANLAFELAKEGVATLG